MQALDSFSRLHGFVNFFQCKLIFLTGLVIFRLFPYTPWWIWNITLSVYPKIHRNHAISYTNTTWHPNVKFQPSPHFRKRAGNQSKWVELKTGSTVFRQKHTHVEPMSENILCWRKQQFRQTTMTWGRRNLRLYPWYKFLPLLSIPLPLKSKMAVIIFVKEILSQNVEDAKIFPNFDFRKTGRHLNSLWCDPANNLA